MSIGKGYRGYLPDVLGAANETSQMIQFTVFGTPQPQGSSKGFVHTDKATGKSRAIITGDNKKNKPWRQEVAQTAMVAMRGTKFITKPSAVEVRLEFYFQRPKSVKTARKITKPDIDKLQRSAFDALTGICFEDDSQVVSVVAVKSFGLPERVEVTVQCLE